METTIIASLLKYGIALSFGIVLILVFYYLYKNNTKKILYIIIFIISGIWLIFYPFILITNCMSLAAPASSPQSFIELLQYALGFLFIITTTFYPIIYVCCLIMTIKLYKKKKNAIIVSLIPFIIMLSIAFLVFLILI